MYKKILITTIIVFISIILLTSFYSQKNNEEDVSVLSEVSDSSLTFEVIGDIHTNIKNFNEVVTDINSINKQTDALILNGDIVNEGLEEEYIKVANLLKDNKNSIPNKLIWNIGNHEFISYDRGQNSKGDIKNSLNLYYKYSNESKPYHNRWIKGYNFISLGSEETYTDDFGCNSPYISNKQLKWLEKKLKERYKEGRPIFVFIHQNLDKVGEYGVDVESREQILDILKSYPEVILFTSHTHISAEEITRYGDNGVTCINTGAIHNNYLQASTGLFEKNEAQGIYVIVKDNEVSINFRNHTKSTWIK